MDYTAELRYLAFPVNQASGHPRAHLYGAYRCFPSRIATDAPLLASGGRVAAMTTPKRGPVSTVLICVGLALLGLGFVVTNAALALVPGVL